MKQVRKIRVEFTDGTYLEAEGDEAQMRYLSPELNQALRYFVCVVDNLTGAQPSTTEGK
jgi:hypothetical protein